MRSEIILAINELIKSGKEEGNALNLPTFKTIDIYPMFRHLFSPKAQATLSNKTNDLIYQFNKPIHGASVLALLGRLNLKTCAAYKDKDSANLYTRESNLVYFIGLRASKEKLPVAIERVVAAVNDLADKDFTKAYLVQLSVIEFAQVDNNEPEFGVVSYITLDNKGAAYMKQNLKGMFTNEGGLPTKVE